MASLFDNNVVIPDPLERTVNTIIKATSQTLLLMEQRHQTAFNAFWNSPDATPQDIADALKAKGIPTASLFQLGAVLVDLINTAKPGTIPVENYKPKHSVEISASTGDVTILEDTTGTVTVVA